MTLDRRKFITITGSTISSALLAANRSPRDRELQGQPDLSLLAQVHFWPDRLAGFVQFQSLFICKPHVEPIGQVHAEAQPKRNAKQSEPRSPLLRLSPELLDHITQRAVERAGNAPQESVRIRCLIDVLSLRRWSTCRAAVEGDYRLCMRDESRQLVG